jgi:Domain of unknown function (DUF4258)
MSETFHRVIDLVIHLHEARISEHGYDEMIQDGIYARDVLAGLNGGIVIEDYPQYPKGPCVLVLQKDGQGKPIHVVWGIPRGQTSPAVVITAYRPDPERWTDDFMRRKE